jgi:hypothetical protein
MAKDEERPVHCGKPMRPIVYGMPGEELFDLSERGEVELGGCCIDDHMPRFRCRRCGATAGEILDQNEHMAHDDWP